MLDSCFIIASFCVQGLQAKESEMNMLAYNPLAPLFRLGTRVASHERTYGNQHRDSLVQYFHFQFPVATQWSPVGSCRCPPSIICGNKVGQSPNWPCHTMSLYLTIQKQNVSQKTAGLNKYSTNTYKIIQMQHLHKCCVCRLWPRHHHHPNPAIVEFKDAYTIMYSLDYTPVHSARLTHPWKKRRSIMINEWIYDRTKQNLIIHMACCEGCSCFKVHEIWEGSCFKVHEIWEGNGRPSNC